MKTLGRTLIILLAALIVVGATMAFADTNLASQTMADSSEGRSSRGGELNRGDFEEGSFRPGHREGHGDHGGSFSIFATLKNLGVISVIVLAVVLIGRLNPKAWLKKNTT